jgi:hypothetical protein
MFDVMVWARSVDPAWVTMKAVTALCFIAAGITIYRQSIIMDVSLVVLSLVSILSGYFGFLEPIGAAKDSTVHSIAPGVPSLSTILFFMGVWVYSVAFRGSFAGFATGLVLLAGGIVALVGYAVDNKSLYFGSDYSTAMAIHTAAGFVFCGISIARKEYEISKDIISGLFNVCRSWVRAKKRATNY